MRPALLALVGLAVGLPVMAALASVDGQTTGGLPARYVPWSHAGRRLHTLASPPHTRSPTPRTALERRQPRPRPQTHGAPHRPAVPPLRPRPRQGPPIRPGRRDRMPQAPPSGLRGPLQERLRPADLRLSIAAPAKVRPHGAFTYAVMLANRGPGTPGAVTVRSLLPAGVVRVGSALPLGVGGYAGGRDTTLVLGPLAPGRSVTARFRVRVRPNARGELVAQSKIVYTGGVADRRPGDNTATVTTRIERRM